MQSSSSFLTARMPDGSTWWACIDGNSLCSTSSIAGRRFAAYLAPFTEESEARQALLDGGADPQTISAEVRPKRARRG